MESLVIRLVLPPLTVVLAGWVQARLGPGRSGRLVGLPLTSGPFLVVLLMTEGASSAVLAARGVTAGQLMVLGFTALYAVLSRRFGASRSLLVVAPAVALLGALTHVATQVLPWPAPVVVAVAAGAALVAWRPRARAGSPTAAASSDSSEGQVLPSVGELAARALLTGVLVAGLAASAPVLGPSLAGVLASLPLVICVVAPAVHARSGGATARAMLRGTLAVVPGTVAFAAVVAATLEPWGGVPAFGLGALVLVAVNAVTAGLDGLVGRGRLAG